MWKDPIVEEIHAVRRALSKKQHNDVNEIVAHLRKRSRDAGRKTVTLSPKRVPKPVGRAKSHRRRSA
jgi:hypothetical protein